jgi:hypothetical protein
VKHPEPLPDVNREHEAELLAAVRSLPLRTREAMLKAARHDRIVTGAYTDSRGGACPLLAAHRRGGRTNAPRFADAWDAYTGATRPRPATQAELAALRMFLAASLPKPEPKVQPARPERPAPQHRTNRFSRRERVYGLKAATGFAPATAHAS